MELFKLFGRIMIDDAEAQASISKTVEKAGGLAETLKKVGKGTEDAGKTMSKFVTGPIVAAGAGLLGLATKAGNYADRILDLNAITGMSTDAIQEYQNVAKIAGVSTEAVTNASQKLTKQMTSMADGTGKSAEALAALGIEFQDLEAISPDDRMDTLITALAGIEDPAERARLGTDLLGGAFADIAPIVALGSEEIDKARKAAHDMGAVMGNDALNDANDFRIAMENLKTQFGSVFNEIGAKFAPLLTDVLLPLIQNKVIPLIDKFTEFVSGLVDKFMNLDEGTQKTILLIVGLVAAIGPVLIIVGKVIALFGVLITVVKALAAAVLFLTSPIGLVILAVVALIAIGVLLWKNWDTVKEKTLMIWEAIKTGIKSAANFIISYINFIIGAYEKLINGLSSAINKIPKIKIPDWVPGLGGKEFGIPNIPSITLPKIPKLAEGGTIEQAGRVMVGERGPEFLDLPRGAKVTPLDKAGITININDAMVMDDYGVDRMMDRVMQRLRAVGVS